MTIRTPVEPIAAQQSPLQADPAHQHPIELLTLDCQPQGYCLDLGRTNITTQEVCYKMGAGIRHPTGRCPKEDLSKGTQSLYDATGQPLPDCLGEGACCARRGSLPALEATGLVAT